MSVSLQLLYSGARHTLLRTIHILLQSTHTRNRGCSGDLQGRLASANIIAAFELLTRQNRRSSSASLLRSSRALPLIVRCLWLLPAVPPFPPCITSSPHSHSPALYVLRTPTLPLPLHTESLSPSTPSCGYQGRHKRRSQLEELGLSKDGLFLIDPPESHITPSPPTSPSTP